MTAVALGVTYSFLSLPDRIAVDSAPIGARFQDEHGLVWARDDNAADGSGYSCVVGQKPQTSPQFLKCITLPGQ